MTRTKKTLMVCIVLVIGQSAQPDAFLPPQFSSRTEVHQWCAGDGYERLPDSGETARIKQAWLSNTERIMEKPLILKCELAISEEPGQKQIWEWRLHKELFVGRLLAGADHNMGHAYNGVARFRGIETSDPAKAIWTLWEKAPWTVYEDSGFSGEIRAQWFDCIHRLSGFHPMSWIFPEAGYPVCCLPLYDESQLPLADGTTRRLAVARYDRLVLDESWRDARQSNVFSNRLKPPNTCR